MTLIYESEKLIIHCEHRGISFYAFVDVITKDQSYIVTKTIPDVGVKLPLILKFSELAQEKNFDRKMSDTLCDTISQNLAAHLI